MARQFPAGIYTPLPAFFKENDELDLEAYTKHLQYIAEPGVFPVVSASIGEAVHLNREERIQLIKTARSALDAIGKPQTPIVAGVGALSTRETIQLAKDAAASGADYALVLPPGYYAGVLQANPLATKKFLVDVAAASPIPVVIYNYPPAAGGIDLDSDTVIEVAKASPNIYGVMLSCGNVGKLARIAAVTGSLEFRESNPRMSKDVTFQTLAGFGDILLPSVAVGASGAISPLSNIAPKFTMKLWNATQSLHNFASLQEARILQGIASLAEASLLRFGLSGVKRAVSQEFGIRDVPRLPLLPISEELATQLFDAPYIAQILKLERSL